MVISLASFWLRQGHTMAATYLVSAQRLATNPAVACHLKTPPECTSAAFRHQPADLRHLEWHCSPSLQAGLLLHDA